MVAGCGRSGNPVGVDVDVGVVWDTAPLGVALAVVGGTGAG